MTTDNLLMGESDSMVMKAVEATDIHTSKSKRKPARSRRVEEKAAPVTAREPVPAPPTPTKPQLGIYRLGDDVQLPQRATDHAACTDIRAWMNKGDVVTIFTAENQMITRRAQTFNAELETVGVVLNPGERILCPTGIIFDIPVGYSVRMHPRSGCSVKEALTLINGEGVIDSDYIDPAFVPLVNHSKVRLFIENGERIAQFEMVHDLDHDIVESLVPPKAVGNRKGGFGSSGKK